MAQVLKREVRDRILDAAEKFFYEKGYCGVSPIEIADKVNISVAFVYTYFKNKETSFKDEEAVIDLAKGLPKGEITLYALWKQQNNENVKYTISFDVNAPHGVEANLIGGEMQAVKVMYGQETTLPKNKFTVEGYTFGGWCTDKDQTKGKSFKDEEAVIDLAKGLPKGEITLYALWKLPRKDTDQRPYSHRWLENRPREARHHRHGTRSNRRTTMNAHQHQNTSHHKHVHSCKPLAKKPDVDTHSLQ